MGDKKWNFREDMLGHNINNGSSKTFQDAEDRLNQLEEKMQKINELLIEDSQIDGAHHKAWCIDQIARIVHGDKYEEFIQAYEMGGCYEWDCGIAP